MATKRATKKRAQSDDPEADEVMARLRQDAAGSGAADMTLEEINEEIRATRQSMKARKRPASKRAKARRQA